MKILSVCGSLRARSSNAFLLAAAAHVAPAHVELRAYEGIATLPHFNPDLDGEGADPPPPVAELRASFLAADAVLISSPEYAHGAPGAFKNMLDWLVSVGELVGMPVALLNASASGGHHAQAAILETLRTMNWSVIAEACIIEPFVTRRIDAEIDDERVLQRLRASIERLAAAPLRTSV